MTPDMLTQKAVVKLPKKNRTSTVGSQDERVYLVSDKLYIDALPPHVTEDEILESIKGCDFASINQKEGYIQFRNREMADRAFTLFNDLTLRCGYKLQFKISPHEDPEPQSQLLQITNLPPHVDNNDVLYDLFRPFGPMILCKILVERDSTFKGSALVHYFYHDHAQIAEARLNASIIQNHVISVVPFVQNNTANIPLQPPSSPSPSNAIDFTNLYIKNLDLNVKSADLFNSFRKYGHIISARVMKYAETKQSKGFGFVSFSRAEEAQQAKDEMNGVYILSKPVVVAFHEPKKPTETEKRSNVVRGRHLQQPSQNINMYEQRYPQHYQPPNKPSHQIPLQRNMSASKNQLSSNKASFRRRGSIESVMTKTSASTRRQTITNAVLSLENSSDSLEDIIDMLLTLKRKDLATCLFNQVFLKAKIRQAKDALGIFQEQETRTDRIPTNDRIVSTNDRIPTNGRILTNDKIPTNDKISVIEQKQKLGDELFPLVKATGIKHAPRITIQLLDNIPLSDLASSMNDKKKLKKYIDQILDNKHRL